MGITADGVVDLALRYLSVRDRGDEVRITYYFTARLRPDVPAPTACTEGRLRWFDIDDVPADLQMPPTAAVALRHWIIEGRHDDLLRSIVMTTDGPLISSLAVPSS